MKRIFSLLLVAIMLLSTLASTISAAGTVIFEDGFDKGFAPRNWVTDPESCHFKYDSKFKCIFGYNSAKVLQSNYGTKYDKWWDKFYASFDFQIRGFDDLPEEEGRTHGISIWYRDLMENDTDTTGKQQGAVYLFTLEFETGTFTLRKEHTWDYKDEYGVTQEAKTNKEIAKVVKEGLVVETGDDAPWYEIGIRVTEGKIECYFEQELIISAAANPTDPKYGDFTLNSVDESVGSQKSAVLLWNDGNYLAVDNFRVMTPDYDFVDVPSVVYGDVNNDTDINIVDVTTMLKIIAGWQNLGANEEAADVNLDGGVTLADVTMTLKFIAGWEGIVLGTKA